MCVCVENPNAYNENGAKGEEREREKERWKTMDSKYYAKWLFDVSSYTILYL